MNLRLLFTLAATLISLSFQSMAADQTRAWRIEFIEPGLIEQARQDPVLAAARQRAGGRLDARVPAAGAYLEQLAALSEQRLPMIAAELGRPVKPRYHYQALFHGLLLDLSDAEADRLASLPGVARVLPEPIHHLATDRGPWWIGADQLWSGAAAPDGLPHRGEGILVGVLDTGINTSHPSFAEVGPVTGHVHVNPLGDGNFTGHCIGSPFAGSSPNPPVPCNNKLIGAWMVGNPATDPVGPEDNNSHGSHTASTAVGNVLDGPYFDGTSGLPIALGTISGVAPHANVIAYDVCETNSCSAVIAGIDRAILDGVDVINFSISGGLNPWNDTDRFFLDAVDAGIFIAASAGNTSTAVPNPVGNVNHRGPWVLSVAASTHDRDGSQFLVDMSGGAAPPADMSGASLSAGFGPAPIVYARDFSNGDPNPEQCLNPFPPGTFSGQIVLCDRGSIARVLKGAHVAAGGAGGMILRDMAASESPVADFHVLPAIHVSLANGQALVNWINGGAGHMGTIEPSPGGSDPSQADVLAGFSLRGPNNSFDVTKPDITGPGVSILAAIQNLPAAPPDAAEVGFLSGTSMSSPHLAGSAALVRQAHPDWTVQEVKSALQMTADETGRKEDNKEDNKVPVDPDDVGNGRVDLRLAALAGLVMDETFENFLAANPTGGGDPRSLNIPSMRHTACSPECSWTRTVRNGQDFESEWNADGDASSFNLMVSPANFALAPGDVIFRDDLDDAGTATGSFQTLTITASGVPADGILRFGNVRMTETSSQAPDAHMTVAVRN